MNSYSKEIFFLLQICAPQGAAMLACSLSKKARKRVAGDVFDTFFATYAGLVDDVTDTDYCYAQSNSIHGRVSSDF